MILGVLLHSSTTQITFILLFNLAKSYGFPYPFYLLIWMSLPLFIIGAFQGLKSTIQLKSVNQHILSIGAGAVFKLYFLNMIEWIFLIFSLMQHDHLSIIDYACISLSTDTIFALVLGKLLLSRSLSFMSYVSGFIALISIILC